MRDEVAWQRRLLGLGHGVVVNDAWLERGVNRGSLLRHAVDISRQLEAAHVSWQADWAVWQAFGGQRNTRPYRPPSPFALTPGCSCKAHHIKLGTQALFCLMRTVGVLPADITSLPKFRSGLARPKDSEVANRWNAFLPKLAAVRPNVGQTFAQVVHTDGVAVSVLFTRHKPEEPPGELPRMGKEEGVRSLTAWQYYRQSGITEHAKEAKVWMAGIKPQQDELSQVTNYTASLQRYREYAATTLWTWPAMWAELSKRRWSNTSFHGKPKLLEKAPARRTAYRVMAKKKRKGSDKKQKGQPKRGRRRGVGPRTLTCPPPFTLTPMARVGVHFIKVDSRVLHGVCKQLGLTKESRAAFTSEPALSHHWARWFNTNKLRNKEFHFERLVDTDGVSVCVHYTRPLPPPPAPPPAASSSSTSSRPSAAAAAAHAVGLPHIGRGIAEVREFVFDPDTQIGVGIDPGVTQAVSAASGVWDPATGQLKADQLRRWKLTKGEVKHASGLNNARRDTERWLAPIKPHLQHLAAASAAGTSLEANLKHITVTLATWDAVWEVYLDPKWARQRLRLYGAQDRALEQFFNKLEEDMAEMSMERHGHAKQLVVFFGAAAIGTGGGWGADAVLRACRKVVCRPRGKDQDGGRVVLVDEHRTTRVSSAVNGKQPCEDELNKLSATRPAGWKPPAGQVEPRLVRPAWSQERGQPVRGLMWCPVVAPRKPPQAPRSSQAATQAAASEPGPSTPLPAKRSKRTKAEPGAAEPTKGKAQGKAAKAKPAPQPGRWLDRDCNAALNMQRIGESRWRPLELCFWPEQGALPAKGKEYPGLGYKRLRDKPPKAQEQQQQPAEAQ
ncbi:hypothetical protein QJQ45_023755 [Haematococcus lacustris]|nr:hypothetical protein QJQ45_023755 [Haematococcus lacustris]